MTSPDVADGSVAAIVQARMGSARLPGKTLELLGGTSVLGWVVGRLMQCERVDEVIVATSVLDEDDAIVRAVDGSEATVVRGSPDDVLDRYVVAAATTRAQRIVRVTADCPFVDPAVVDQAVATLDSSGADYVSTSLDGRFPRGLDVEVISRSALESAAIEAVETDEREHVTLFVYRHTDRFRCLPVVAPVWARHPELRFTLDEPADLDLLRAVVSDGGVDLSTSGRDVVAYLLGAPHIAALNLSVQHRNVK